MNSYPPDPNIAEQNDPENQAYFSPPATEPDRFRPYAVWALIACNVLMFLLSGSRGGWGETDSETLFHLGSLFAPSVWQGQWWRLGSAMFLHGGILHLGLNVWALHNLGAELERIYGSRSFLALYFGAGWLGGLASLIWSGNSVGASGAVFGIAGAWLAIALRYKAYFREFGAQVLGVVAINLVIGFQLPGIDSSAHLGGLVGGFLLGNFLPNLLPEFRATPQRWAATIGLLILFLVATPVAVAISRSVLESEFSNAAFGYR